MELLAKLGWAQSDVFLENRDNLGDLVKSLLVVLVLEVDSEGEWDEFVDIEVLLLAVSLHI